MGSFWPGPWTPTATRSSPCGSATWTTGADPGGAPSGPTTPAPGRPTPARSSTPCRTRLNRPYQVRRHTLRRRDAGCTDELVLAEEPDARFELTVAGTRSGELVLITAESRDTTEIVLAAGRRPDPAAAVIWPRRAGIEYAVDHVPGPATGGSATCSSSPTTARRSSASCGCPWTARDPRWRSEVLAGDPRPAGSRSTSSAGSRWSAAGATPCPSCSVLDLASGSGHDDRRRASRSARSRLARNEDPRRDDRPGADPVPRRAAAAGTTSTSPPARADPGQGAATCRRTTRVAM